jgi:ubiquinone/menaquinone biosynthesis C-methylase UbiE
MSNNKKGKSPITWNPKNVFSGTARYYARYRPGYPDEVFQLLRKKFSPDHFSRVLDLGCGTGQVALPIAPFVSEVIAVDPQMEMLEETGALAAAGGIQNIRWIPGESGDLPQMAAAIGEIDLTVIARAFHWMDREQTLKDLYPLTRPGGGAAVISDSGPRDGMKLPWKEVIDRAVKCWLGEVRKAGTQGAYSHPTKRFDAYLKESAFRNLETALIQVERTWNLDQIIGYLYSTSSSSIPVLGNKKAPFEAEVRAGLQKLEPPGQFKEPVTIEILMAWKTAS